MIGCRPANVTEPTRISLAQFSKALVSQGQPVCVVGSTENLSPESGGQKRFASDVVAAMSNPAFKVVDPEAAA